MHYKLLVHCSKSFPKPPPLLKGFPRWFQPQAILSDWRHTAAVLAHLILAKTRRDETSRYRKEDTEFPGSPKLSAVAQPAPYRRSDCPAAQHSGEKQSTVQQSSRLWQQSRLLLLSCDAGRSKIRLLILLRPTPTWLAILPLASPIMSQRKNLMFFLGETCFGEHGLSRIDGPLVLPNCPFLPQLEQILSAFVLNLVCRRNTKQWGSKTQ